MIVYGDPAAEVLLSDAAALLALQIGKLRIAPDDADLLHQALTFAGQIEQGVWDLEGADASHDLSATAASATDVLAASFLRGAVTASVFGDLDRLVGVMARDMAISVQLKTPEGFAFYGLYPEQYALAAKRLVLDTRNSRIETFFVLGLRSIGTTLSAIVAAAIRAQGLSALRTTERPSGHPYARVVHVDAGRLSGWHPGSVFAVVVDEGPGRSGSSMAAGVTALERIGVPSRNVALFPGHSGKPGPEASPSVRAIWDETPIYAVDPAAVRWNGLTLLETLRERTSRLLGIDAAALRLEDAGGGQWRGLFPGREDLLAYPPFERMKLRYSSPDGRGILWKFDGLGACGGWPLGGERLAQSTAAAPRALGRVHGYIALPWISGRPLSASDLTPEVIGLLARQIAAVGPQRDDRERLAAFDRIADMVCRNAGEALGARSAESLTLLAESVREEAAAYSGPSYGDGRLAPHEWILAESGGIVKTDAGGHDADHTVIGSQPVIWDIAGAIVEWKMDGAAIECLRRSLAEYGIGWPAARALAFYTAAYAAFWLGMLDIAGDGEAAARERRRERLTEVILSACGT